MPVISAVPQGSVQGHLLFILHTFEMFYLVENKLVTSADYSTLLAAVREHWQTNNGYLRKHKPNLKLSVALSAAVTVAHVDTTGVTLALSMVFFLAIPGYTLANLQWSPTDN